MIEFDRRKMERFSLELPTYLSVANKGKKQESIELMTSNVCARGAFFKTEKPLSVGNDVKIALIIPLDKLYNRFAILHKSATPLKKGNSCIIKSKNLEGKRSRIDVSGSVIRKDQQGMAICFDKKYKISPYL